MRKRGHIFESKKGPWGQVTVYSDYVLLRPNLTWCRDRVKVIRHLLRGRRLREYDYPKFGPMVLRKMLAMATRGRWYVLPNLTGEKNIQVINDQDMEQVLLIDKSEPWPINATIVWLERTHDGIERHFMLKDILRAQKMYESGDIMGLKMWIVDALALGNVKFASALSRCVTDKLPSGKIAQPMDMYAFWAEGGNIFAHTAFGEKVRLFKAEEVDVATSSGYMFWRDFKSHSRRSALSALKTYF